ncbi:hypothetical protein ACIBHX_27900 [Nonomuraea sp. NPDC050536]|uniref:hypothetical protein n=1 Tax=Nonomuraea sp. NPDC050536 TaxID=3364366 RepID=UPI0037C74E05
MTSDDAWSHVEAGDAVGSSIGAGNGCGAARDLDTRNRDAPDRRREVLLSMRLGCADAAE